MRKKAIIYTVQRKFPDGKKWHSLSLPRKTITDARSQLLASVSMDQEEGFKGVKHRIIKRTINVTDEVVK